MEAEEGEKIKQKEGTKGLQENEDIYQEDVKILFIFRVVLTNDKKNLM